MRTQDLLCLAARLYAQHGCSAEVYVPVLLTSADILQEVGPLEARHRGEAKARLERRLRDLGSDAPDAVMALVEWAMAEASREVPRTWRMSSTSEPVAD